MKFIANISMCDSTYYVPLAQAAEAAGFDTIAVPDSHRLPEGVVVDVPLQLRRHARVPREQAVHRTDRRDLGHGRGDVDHRVPHLRAQDADPPPRALREGGDVAGGAQRQPVRARRRHEPVAGRLRDRPAAVGGTRSTLRRVHRDRARPRRRWLLRAPRRVLRLPGDQDGAGAERADPRAHRGAQRRATATGGAPRRRLDGRGRHARRPDPDDRPHERPAQGVRPRAASGSTSTRPTPESFTVDGIKQLEDLGVTHTAGGFGRFNPYALETDPETLQEKIDNLNRHGDEIISKLR